MFVAVTSWEEEWRTATRRVQWPLQRGRPRVSYGRVCLWLRLACGHCVQRMASLRKDGSYEAPVRARCGQCS